ncbi:MAG: C10 family peptidase [Muribaculaceae bacterium]|nr:C10 family peptidase [Muribaculaceae bacterium]
MVANISNSKRDGKTGGHSWIIDGLLHIPYDPDNKLAPNNSPDAYFMHCVWGWYGRANGYYRIDGFGNLASDRHSKENSDTTYPGYTDGESNYVINQELWGYYGFKKKPIISGGVIVDPVQPVLP